VDRREQLSAEYLALNPRGVVPTLIHDGKAIRESQVILEYLEDAFPEPPLRPSDPYHRAQMRLWTKLADEGLHTQSRVLAMCIYLRHVNQRAGDESVRQYYEEMREPVRRSNDLINIEKGLDSPLLPAAVAYHKQIALDIDRALEDRPWLAGDMFSLADISLGVYFTRLLGLQMEPLLADLGRLSDWYRRFKSRPSYEQGIGRWGEATAAERVRYAAEAFPTIQTLWNADTG